jgi:hypothetical protein
MVECSFIQFYSQDFAPLDCCLQRR